MGMRLFVIGANGRTGTEIIDLARTRGHEITAFVRSPQKLKPAPFLNIIRGDPLRPETIAAALSGHDAVLSAIGPHLPDALRPSKLLGDCTRATVQAMAASRIARLAIVSAAVLFRRGVSILPSFDGSSSIMHATSRRWSTSCKKAASHGRLHGRLA